jgi:hypothetical protein
VITNLSDKTQEPSFAIVTPSYAPDFERCRLLSWSLKEFVSPSVTHYIIVDQSDLPLFSQLKSPNTEIITKESILPWWIKKVPFGKKNKWLSLKTLPLRGWHVQQIIKIAVAQHINKDVLVFVDSDVAFIRPFNLLSFTRGDKVQFFRIPSVGFPTVEGEQGYLKWHRTASRLLGLPAMDYPLPGYIGNVVTWRRDNVLKMYQKIEEASGQQWIKALCNSFHISEYVLYGVFIDHFLQENSGHYFVSNGICKEYWSDVPMSDEQLQNFFAEMPPGDVAVMISAKAGMSVEHYQTLLAKHSITRV